MDAGLDDVALPGAVVIPHTDLDLSRSLPGEASYWEPTDDDLLGEEGFGYFRDTWIVAFVPLDYADRIVRLEQQLLPVIDALAPTEEKFDAIASALEHGDLEALRHELGDPGDWQKISSYADEIPPFDGLEFGVAGLVNAIAAVGCFPAASCRGHSARTSWSDYPVVLFAADEPRARVLEEHVRRSRCGFVIDAARPSFLGISAGSVERTIELAELVLREHTRYPDPRRPPEDQNR